MSRRHLANSGFTLLEMLAATALTCMLAGSLYVSLHVAFKARSSAMASLESGRQGQWAMELLKADLLSAAVPNGILAGGFVGQSKEVSNAVADTLTFYAAAMDIEPRPGVGDIKKIEYACQIDPNSGRTLLVRQVTTNLLSPVVPQPIQEVLCRGVRDFSLRYFDGSAWLENWDSTTLGNLLPVAVEITIELVGDTGNETSRFSQVVLIPCGQASEMATSGGSS